jgi:hypothetical protein
MRNSILRLFFWDIIISTICAILGESFGVFYSYFISYMIRFLKNQEAPTSDGIKYLLIFFFA